VLLTKPANVPNQTVTIDLDLKLSESFIEAYFEQLPHLYLVIELDMKTASLEDAILLLLDSLTLCLGSGLRERLTVVLYSNDSRMPVVIKFKNGNKNVDFINIVRGNMVYDRTRSISNYDCLKRYMYEEIKRRNDRSAAQFLIVGGSVMKGSVEEKGRLGLKENIQGYADT
jgi:hypothetical protein